MGDLKGTVSFQKKNLATGGVHVQGSDGLVKSSTIDENGQYEVKGIAAGTVKITVSSPNPAAQKMGIRKKDQPPPPPKENPNWFPIPENFAEFDKSGLTYPLKRGANSWDIELK